MENQPLKLDENKRSSALSDSIELPSGAVLKNRLAKSPMSDSLGDGEGNPTDVQIRLYEKWATGGVALSIIGEVQGDPRFPEKPGNLVLGKQANHQVLRSLTSRASINGAHIWPQLGHAGALSHLPVSTPKGPSPLNVEGLQSHGMTLAEIQQLPDMFAKTASYAKDAGFTGVHIHAGHGFLLSQFLSPLFNHRTDGYGGSIEARARIIQEIVEKTRIAVGPTFPIGIRINATDKLDGGLTETDALEVVRILDRTTVDLIDISGGTYFPGAKASSDGVSKGKPYFLKFAKQAKTLTSIPLMLTGGFTKQEQAIEAIEENSADIIGLARALVLNPRLAEAWAKGEKNDPVFPRFQSPPQGGITAWYSMRLTAIGEDKEDAYNLNLETALKLYNERDEQRNSLWMQKFSSFYD
ncbi:MAG: hypothetical protein V7776_20310 [Halopseudomonas aestusnigri]